MNRYETSCCKLGIAAPWAGVACPVLTSKRRLNLECVLRVTPDIHGFGMNRPVSASTHFRRRFWNLDSSKVKVGCGCGREMVMPTPPDLSCIGSYSRSTCCSTLDSHRGHVHSSNGESSSQRCCWLSGTVCDSYMLTTLSQLVNVYPSTSAY